MDKVTFKTSFYKLLEQDVIALTADKKIKYMKNWIRDYEQANTGPKSNIKDNDSIKIGLLVRTTVSKLVDERLLTEERVELLQDERYCKSTFDINYPFLKKVISTLPLSGQRKIKGYDRYWANVININNEKFLICNDWYERNKPKFIKWVNELQ